MRRRDLLGAMAAAGGARCAAATEGGVFLFDGDSIAAGSGATPGGALAEGVVARLGWRGRVHNTARWGRPMAECLRLYDRNVAPLAEGAEGPRLLFIQAGDNDIDQGASGAAAHRALVDYVARARAQRWRVIASTKLARPDFPFRKRVELAAYNRLVLANAAGAEAVVDFAAIPEFARVANRTNPDLFTADRVHPSDGGYAILARETARAAAPLLAGG